MSRKAHILLIEDNPGDADLTREVLMSHRVSVDVTVVPDGAEALALLSRMPPYENTPLPDLILLDLNLPKMDGRRVLNAIKQQDAFKRIPVIILTSSDAPRDVQESYELGANCYITKPADLRALQALLQLVQGFWLTVAKLP